MMVEKPWGTTDCVIKTPFVEAHKIIVKPFGNCSWHKHERKWNAFVGVSGLLTIKGTGLIVELRPGGVYAVPPNELHMFTAGDFGSTVIELYYPAELSEDIVRYNVTHLEDVA